MTEEFIGAFWFSNMVRFYLLTAEYVVTTTYPREVVKIPPGYSGEFRLIHPDIQPMRFRVRRLHDGEHIPVHRVEVSEEILAELRLRLRVYMARISSDTSTRCTG